LVIDATKNGTDPHAVKLTTNAAAILSAQISDIDSIILDEEDLMCRLYDFWEDSNIDHLRGNLIVRVISSINEGQPEKAVQFLKNNPQIVPAFMKHLETNAAADFFAHLLN